MRNDVLLSPWELRYRGTALRDDFAESIFYTGNGRMGARGYLPCGRAELGVQTGLYVAGIFGEIKPGITDIVNLPTPLYEEYGIDGAPALPAEAERVYDLRAGHLTMRYTLSGGGKSIGVSYERFFSRERAGLCLQRTTVRSSEALTLEIQSGILLSSCNSPVPDDQTRENAETLPLAEAESAERLSDGFACAFRIRGTGLAVRESCRFSPSPERVSGLTARFTVSLAAGESFTLDKLAYISTSRDVDPTVAMPEEWSFNALLAEQRASWAAMWAKCDLPMEDAELCCALRYAMLQLVSNCSRRDPSVSIGARGLTHARYKGCYFWDTDMFLLPFFLENDPEAAKNLCEYRVRALPAAKKHAKKMNALGARYPWMASLDGSEQCETWDIGCSELHITADVVYALDRYCKTCGDRAFYLDRAAEVYIETARFWVSRYSFDRERKNADLLWCKGPDEYCGATINNLYTNVMVQHNLALAVSAAKALQSERLEKYTELRITEEELADWELLRSCIKWPRDPQTGRLTTDELFHRLESVDITEVKKSAAASYHDVCFDRLQRYKLIKQADVLLLMTRFPELFSEREKLDAWNDFEPICLHDSTLSFASHALFALENGLAGEGMAYLRKALLLDLRDIMSSTGKEGLHLACMGEAWQAAVSMKR